MTMLGNAKPPPTEAPRARQPSPFAVSQVRDSTHLDLRRRKRRHAERWFAFAGICLISIGFIFPFVWMLSTSLKTLEKTIAPPPRLIPDKIEMHAGAPLPENYFRVVTHDKMDF